MAGVTYVRGWLGSLRMRVEDSLLGEGSTPGNELAGLKMKCALKVHFRQLPQVTRIQPA
jgi:hypothetical protein